MSIVCSASNGPYMLNSVYNYQSPIFFSKYTLQEPRMFWHLQCVLLQVQSELVFHTQIKLFIKFVSPIGKGILSSIYDILLVQMLVNNLG